MARGEWKNTVEDIRNVVLAAIKPLEEGFDFHVEKVDIGDDPYPEIVARNQLTFLEISWSPQDGFWYEMGPLVDQEIPPEQIGPAGPVLDINRYEIAWFSELIKESMPMVRGKSGSVAEAVPNAIGFLIQHASDCLRGDWSRRPALDALIRAWWKLHNDTT